MAAKCCSSPAISVGSALGVRWSGRANALVVRGFTSSAPIEQGASPTGGSTSPRDPYVDTAHAFRHSRFPRFSSPRPAILRHDPGLAASPPVRYTLRVERDGHSPFSLIVRCGRTISSRSGGSPRTADGLLGCERPCVGQAVVPQHRGLSFVSSDSTSTRSQPSISLPRISKRRTCC
jgi:hypothetical protein